MMRSISASTSRRRRRCLSLLWLLAAAAIGLLYNNESNNSSGVVIAYSPQQHSQQQRRQQQQQQQQHQQLMVMKRRLFFTKAASTAVVSSSTAAAIIMLAKPQTAHSTVDVNVDVNVGNVDVISSKYCAYGEGDGCQDLAEGNPFILELQRKSAANKETIQQEARNAFYMKNYPDWFASVGKSMIKKPDGTFMVVTDKELAVLKAQNKIGLEYAKTMGGKVTDVTQKPIMVLKENE
jgi:hypothetical protein